ncbi:hypothetical protein FQZ97_817340 [compost metagenome]
MPQRLGRQALVHFRMRCADQVRYGQQRQANAAQQPVAGEGDQRQASGGGRGGTDPPVLAQQQVGGGGARQFRRQVGGRRQVEHGETAEAPEQALPGAVRRAQGEQAGEHQGEADGHHQVAQAGGQGALPAILGRPGLAVVAMPGGFLVLVLVCDSRFAVAVLGHRLGVLEGFRLEDQRGDPQALQKCQQDGGEQAGEARGPGDALDHGGVSVAGESGAVAGVVGGVVHRLDVREAGEEDQQRAEQAAAGGDRHALGQGERNGCGGRQRAAGHDGHLPKVAMTGGRNAAGEWPTGGQKPARARPPRVAKQGLRPVSGLATPLQEPGRPSHARGLCG